MVIIVRKTKENDITSVIFETRDSGINLPHGEHVVAKNIERSNVREKLTFLHELIEKYFQKDFNESSFIDTDIMKQTKFCIDPADVRFIESPQKFQYFAESIYGWLERGEGKNYKQLSLEG